MKHEMNKKTLVTVLTAALLLAGCQKQPLDTPDDLGAGQLIVNASVDGVPVAQADGVQTRAADTDADLMTHGFYLAGYYTTGQIDASAATAVPNVFNKEVNDQQVSVPLVTYDGNKFVLKTIKWALNDITYLSFFGWSQSKQIPTSGVNTATTGIIGQTTNENDKGYPWIDIRNADAPADQTDVLGSRSLDHKNDAVISAVDLDFRHLLTKLTFKAKSSSKANVDITAVNIKYAPDKVRKKARYTFGSAAATLGTFGSFAEYHSGTVALGTTYPAVTQGAEVVLGSALLIPQALNAGDVSIEIKYHVSPNSGDITGPEQTKTLPLAAFTFEQGNNYLYVLDIKATELFLPAYPVVANWNFVSGMLPLVPGPADGQTLLLLDGYEKPYIHSDGKAYWLDRSGYNNHCEIVGNVGYDKNLKCYVFTNGTTEKGSIKVPALGDHTGGAMTVELVAQTWTLTKNQVFSFYHNGNRQLFSHLISAYDATFWDTGGIDGTGTSVGQRMSFVNIASHLSQVALMSYTYDASSASKYQHIMRNMQKMKMNSDFTSVHNSFNLNEGGTLGYTFEGSIHQLKIIKKAKRAVDPAELKALARKFNFTYDSYVQDGLLLDLQGETAPSTHAGQSVWVDNSPNENHAFYNGDAAVSGIYHDAAYKCYSFSGKGFMQFIKSIGNNTNNMTLEVVVKSQNSSGGLGGGCVVQFNTLLDDASGTSTAYRNRGGIYWPNASSVLLEAAHTENAGSGSSGRRFNESHADLLSQYGINVASKASISLVRDGNTLSFRHNGKESGLGTRTNPEALPQWTVGRVGGQSYNTNANYTGAIYAVRLYNRVLTDEERKANYELDKKLYNL